jgi:hypothetical protein
MKELSPDLAIQNIGYYEKNFPDEKMNIKGINSLIILIYYLLFYIQQLLLHFLMG